MFLALEYWLSEIKCEVHLQICNAMSCSKPEFQFSH